MRKLRAEREARGWTRAELARRAEMNPSTVGLIEAGRFIAYETQLKRLARALRLPAAEAHRLLDDVADVGHEPSAPVASSGGGRR